MANEASMLATQLKKRLASLSNIPAKIFRNRDLITNAATAALTLDKRERKERIKAVQTTLLTKITGLDEQANIENAKGQAKRLIVEWPWLKSHLQDTPHFGVLQEMVSPIDPTRLFYVGLQLELSIKLKNSHRALGLGSTLSLSEGNSGIPKSTTGLELVQLWSLLLSGGHLFGTYATERALAYRLRREPRTADEFLASIHGPARQHCEQAVRNGSMNSLAAPLASWIISNQIKDASLRTMCLSALSIYQHSTSNEQVRKLRALYERIRQTAYHSVQGRCSIVLMRDSLQPEVASISLAASTKNIVEDENLSFDPEVIGTTPHSELLAAVDRYQETQFFMSPQANKLVLNHIREFKTWWREQENKSIPLNQKILSLFKKPVDWPKLTTNFDHVVRLEIQSSTDPARWVDGVRQWVGAPMGGHWHNANFLLSHTKATTIIDIFSPGRASINPATASHIASLLSSNVEVASYSTILARSIARFGQLLLSKTLNPEYETFLTPCQGSPQLGLAIIENDLGRLSSTGAKCGEQSIDSRRNVELKNSLDVVRSIAHDSPPTAWLLFTGSIQIFRRNSPDPISDLDGVTAVFFEDHIQWLLLENKSGRQRGARKQLDDLRSLFCLPLSSTEQSTSSNGQTAWMSMRWNGDPQPA